MSCPKPKMLLQKEIPLNSCKIENATLKKELLFKLPFIIYFIKFLLMGILLAAEIFQ